METINKVENSGFISNGNSIQMLLPKSKFSSSALVRCQPSIEKKYGLKWLQLVTINNLSGVFLGEYITAKNKLVAAFWEQDAHGIVGVSFKNKVPQVKDEIITSERLFKNLPDSFRKFIKNKFGKSFREIINDYYSLQPIEQFFPKKNSFDDSKIQQELTKFLLDKPEEFIEMISRFLNFISSRFANFQPERTLIQDNNSLVNLDAAVKLRASLEEQISTFEKKCVVYGFNLEPQFNDDVKEIINNLTTQKILLDNLINTKSNLQSLAERLTEKDKKSQEYYFNILQFLINYLINVDIKFDEYQKQFDSYAKVVQLFGEFLYDNGSLLSDDKFQLERNSSDKKILPIIYFSFAGTPDEHTLKKLCYLALLNEDKIITPNNFSLENYCKSNPEKYIDLYHRLYADETYDLSMRFALEQGNPYAINEQIKLTHFLGLAYEASKDHVQAEKHFVTAKTKLIEGIKKYGATLEALVIKYFLEDFDAIVAMADFYDKTKEESNKNVYLAKARKLYKKNQHTNFSMKKFAALMMRSQNADEVKIGFDFLRKAAEDDDETALEIIAENKHESLFYEIAEAYFKKASKKNKLNQNYDKEFYYAKALLLDCLSKKINIAESYFLLYLMAKELLRAYLFDYLFEAALAGHPLALTELENQGNKYCTYPYYLLGKYYCGAEGKRNYTEAAKNFQRSDSIEAKINLFELIYDNKLSKDTTIDPVAILEELLIEHPEKASTAIEWLTKFSEKQPYSLAAISVLARIYAKSEPGHDFIKANLKLKFVEVIYYNKISKDIPIDPIKILENLLEKYPETTSAAIEWLTKFSEVQHYSLAAILALTRIHSKLTTSFGLPKAINSHIQFWATELEDIEQLIPAITHVYLLPCFSTVMLLSILEKFNETKKMDKLSAESNFAVLPKELYKRNDSQASIFILNNFKFRNYLSNNEIINLLNDLNKEEFIFPLVNAITNLLLERTSLSCYFTWLLKNEAVLIAVAENKISSHKLKTCAQWIKFTNTDEFKVIMMRRHLVGSNTQNNNSILGKFKIFSVFQEKTANIVSDKIDYHSQRSKFYLGEKKRIITLLQNNITELFEKSGQLSCEEKISYIEKISTSRNQEELDSIIEEMIKESDDYKELFPEYLDNNNNKAKKF